MEDLGELRHILGLDINYDNQEHRLRISQKAYVETVLKRFSMQDCKPVLTPMDPKKILQQCQNESDKMDDKSFRALVGSLMYLLLGTRPDIAYAVGCLSQHLEKPTQEHWTAAKRVLRYLQKTKEYKLTFEKSERGLIFSFSDASWGNTADRKSISGHAVFHGNWLVSWSSKKQPTVALSSTEAELISLTEAIKEPKWISKLMMEMIGIDYTPLPVQVDNQSTIAIAYIIPRASCTWLFISSPASTSGFEMGIETSCNIYSF